MVKRIVDRARIFAAEKVGVASAPQNWYILKGLANTGTMREWAYVSLGATSPSGVRDATERQKQLDSQSAKKIR